MSRPPLPPFDAETAAQKARMAEDAWNSRDPARVALAYTEDSRWRNRAEFIQGRAAIEAFLTRKWARELDYRLIKEMWAFAGARIAVRFVADVATVTRDKDGNVVAGSLDDAIESRDIWTFSRDVTAAGPDWLLDETDEG